MSKKNKKISPLKHYMHGGGNFHEHGPDGIAKDRDGKTIVSGAKTANGYPTPEYNPADYAEDWYTDLKNNQGPADEQTTEQVNVQQGMEGNEDYLMQTGAGNNQQQITDALANQSTMQATADASYKDFANFQFENYFGNLENPYSDIQTDFDNLGAGYQNATQGMTSVMDENYLKLNKDGSRSWATRPKYQNAAAGFTNVAADAQNVAAGMTNVGANAQNVAAGMTNYSAGMSNVAGGAQNAFAGAKNTFAGMQNAYAGLENQFAGMEHAYSGLENQYEGMENAYEDMTIDQRAADFQAQQGQQQRANIMQGLRGAAGSSGVAGLAQAMASQGQLQAQQQAAGIGQQERQNQMMRAQEGSRIDQMQRGESARLASQAATGTMSLQQQERAGAAQLQSQQAGAAMSNQMASAQGAMQQQQMQMQGASEQQRLQMQGAMQLQGIQGQAASQLQNLNYQGLAAQQSAQLAGAQNLQNLNYQGLAAQQSAQLAGAQNLQNQQIAGAQTLQSQQISSAQNLQNQQIASNMQLQQMEFQGATNAQQNSIAQNNLIAQGAWASDMASAQGAMDVQGMEFGQQSTLLGIDYANLAGANEAVQMGYSNELAYAGLEQGVNMQNSANQANKGPSLLEQGLQLYMMYQFSDRKLKKNIIKIGESPSGLNIYSFEYKDSKYGKGLFQGVMSDEIPQEAVMQMDNGYDAVDYSKLDVEFKQI